MKCSKCGLREATTEVLHSINGHAEKLYLCDECAAAFRPDMGFDKLGIFDKLLGVSPMGLVTNFGGLFDTQSDRSIVCPDCKTTSEEFLQTGFVGCPRCYEVFEPLVRRTVKKLQQSDIHIGKSPYGMDPDAEESTLKTQLQIAIDNGDYGAVGELGKRLEQIRLARNGKEDR